MALVIKRPFIDVIACKTDDTTGSKTTQMVKLCRRGSRSLTEDHGDITVAARPPKQLRLTSRWPALRRLVGKISAEPDRHCANARVIHDYFHHKACSQGYTLSHSQQRVIDCMAQHASTLLGTSGKALPGLYLHGAVGRGKSWLLDGFFQAIPIAKSSACTSTVFLPACTRACSAIATNRMRWRPRWMIY